MSRVNHKLALGHLKGKPSNYAIYWLRHISFNREMLHICKHIKVYSRYWSAFLTILFPYYIFLICYLIYMVLVVGSVPFSERSLFMCIAVEIVGFFFMLINECAQLVRCNDKVLRENRRFFCNFFAFGQLRLKGKHYADVLKVS